MGVTRRRFGQWKKLKNHPGEKMLDDLARRKLTMRRSLQILEHISTCNRCYRKLMRVMTTK